MRWRPDAPDTGARRIGEPAQLCGGTRTFDFGTITRRIDGIERAPQGYVIVKGGGIPAISVIRYNRAVDWPELVDRLKRTTQDTQANGRPEWENEICSTFAQRWVQRAPAGLYYQDASGTWAQK